MAAEACFNATFFKTFSNCDVFRAQATQRLSFRKCFQSSLGNETTSNFIYDLDKSRDQVLMVLHRGDVEECLVSLIIPKRGVELDKTFVHHQTTSHSNL